MGKFEWLLENHGGHFGICNVNTVKRKGKQSIIDPKLSIVCNSIGDIFDDGLSMSKLNLDTYAQKSGCHLP